MDHGPYHRLESGSQTPRDAAVIEASGELWGRPHRWSNIPQVKAYRGALPPGMRGIEFFAACAPCGKTAPDKVRWLPELPGVEVEGDFAKIKVRVTRNTQV